MKKKIVTLCLVIALLAVTVAGASLAYFTDTKSADNVFTMGDVEIELEEPKWPDPDPDDPDKPEFFPGIAYDKNPHVHNTGDTAAWIRMKVTFTKYDKFLEAAKNHNLENDWAPIAMLDGRDSDSDKTANTGWWMNKAETVVSDDNKEITYVFYYKTLLTAGKDAAPDNCTDEDACKHEAFNSTTELFQSVTIPTWFDNNDKELFVEDPNAAEKVCKFDIIVTADAIQDADAFAVQEGDTLTSYEKAFAAFDNP